MTIEGKRLVTVSVTKEIADAASAAYHAEDVLCENATTGVPWTFAAIAKVNGGTGYIVKAHVISETTAVIPRLTLYLFNATPTSELRDHVLNTAPLHANVLTGSYQGKIDFPAMEDLGGDSESVATPSTYGNLPLAFQCATAADDLIGILVTRDVFTQVAAKDITINLTCEQY